MKKVLLLSCCAPCFCYVLEEVSKCNNVTLCFYNPNIRPMDEYEKRKEEQKRVCEKFNVPFVELEYDNDQWCALTSGLEDEPEKGKRCDICFYMRLKRVMEYAKCNGFDAVTSVLGVSRYKDEEQVRRVALKASKETGMVFMDMIPTGEFEAHKLAKDLDLYRQKYCGCKPL